MTTQPSFDRVARIYRWAEYLALGPLLQRTRTYFLPKLRDRHQALVLGDGDGRFLTRLLERNPTLQATAVDTSAAMLRLLTQRCHADAHRLRTIHNSAFEIAPPPGTDLVVTHFFLDCFTQPEVDALCQQIAACIQPGTLWVVSDFGLPTATIPRTFTRVYIRALYASFRVLTGLRVTQLPNPQTALHQAGFTRIDRHERLAGLLYTELWQRD